MTFKVLLGVTGSIAAYKSLELIRLLRQEGISVQVVLTRAGAEFVTPLSLQALSGRPVRQSLWDQTAEHAMDHIQLASWPDCVLIAPASANALAKLAHGVADDLLSTLCLVTRAPIGLAPAMNVRMWEHEATQANVALLKSRGVAFLGPALGLQACGDEGPGRFWEPSQLAAFVLEQRAVFKPLPDLKGQKILITAGPTVESIDPVRFLSNRSSGKMGYALAEAAVFMGAEVTLISGPVSLEVPRGLSCIQVESARDMHAAVMGNLPGQSIFIAAAAVSDYAPVEVFPHKHKKSQGQLDLVLSETPDILSDVVKAAPGIWTVGFAAETRDMMLQAQEKRERKGASWVIANRVGWDENGIMRGFGTDTHEVTVISDDPPQILGPCSKKQLAQQIMQLLSKKIGSNS